MIWDGMGWDLGRSSDRGQYWSAAFTSGKKKQQQQMMISQPPPSPFPEIHTTSKHPPSTIHHPHLGQLVSLVAHPSATPHVDGTNPFSAHPTKSKATHSAATLEAPVSPVQSSRSLSATLPFCSFSRPSSISLPRSPLHSFVPLSHKLLHPSLSSTTRSLSVHRRRRRRRYLILINTINNIICWRRTFRHPNPTPHPSSVERDCAVLAHPRRDLPVAHTGRCHHYTHHHTIDDNRTKTNEHYIVKHSSHTLNPTPTRARVGRFQPSLEGRKRRRRGRRITRQASTATTTFTQNACRKHDRPAHGCSIVLHEEIVAGPGEEVQMSVL
ncbi:uncharacterized protein LY89DRAFT_266089 [Mollisia scopiformis]|uniref:Uncharacterized protein n=1 Tax=Mollisia scopiformis TaxID=149040 RepID=A0A132BDJ2_MOLSC|nr:uncharacterized protein LY89DRAFT_266089 [Mollisia scopiformis]KUJ09914.1 hypothetical protein LY89DRAFT_266089 [Mollisia scopiformis]